ncbi:MAG: DUF58 domain-containing protein [Alphaproteobacteria bacterium]|nr:MAG: DUF58 domain-containing protein [Alphaproteobacteria bacterium]
MGRLSDILHLRREAEHHVSDLPALMIKAEKISANIMHGMHAQRKAGSGEKFWQFREYQETDRPQDIDWRQSAKTDQVLVKQREWQTTQRTYLWCASGASMDFASSSKHYTKQDTAHIIALSLALLLRQSEEQIGLFGDLKTGHSEDKIQNIGQLLLQQSPINAPLPDTTHFALPRHASFIGIGDFLSPIEDITRSMASVSTNAENGLLIQILDLAELELSYKGRVRFRGIEDSELELVNNVSSIRQEYKQRINHHTNQVKALCHEQNWSYILHNTHDDIADTLKNIWQLMDRTQVQP